MLPGQELGWLDGALPIAGVSLALRDALAGSLDLLLAAWTLSSRWAMVSAPCGSQSG